MTTIIAQIPEIPKWSGEGGVIGAIIFITLALFIFGGGGFGYFLKYILDKNTAAMKDMGESNRQAFASMAAVHEKSIDKVTGEMKEGFSKMAMVHERRDIQQQQLFDKHLDVTIKVTDSLGKIGSEVATNTREIAELKSVFREFRGGKT